MIDHLKSFAILAGILIVAASVLMANDGNGYFFGLLAGLFLIIKFRQLGEFAYKDWDNKPVPASEKWALLIQQIVTLIVGLVFFVVSLLKLLPLIY